MVEEIYLKEPYRIHNGIPVFSLVNNYIENYEKISHDHVEHFNRTGKNPFMEEGYWQSVEQTTKELIQRYSKDGDKILDVGVGLGRLLEDFTRLKRYGMDISTSYLDITKKKGIDCCLSLIEDMPYKDLYFDVITCTDVLEHVLDLNLAIKNILRVLKKNGILIIRVPYKENIEWYLSEDCPYEFVHLRSFDENSLKALFKKIFPAEIIEWNTAGFNSDFSRLKYPIPPYNIWLRNLTRIYYVMRAKNKMEFQNLLNGNEINYVIRKI
jgi:ubiquinone/menaquinone biosynthesis C-methylase UbiE